MRLKNRSTANAVPRRKLLHDLSFRRRLHRIQKFLLGAVQPFEFSVKTCHGRLGASA